MPTADYTQEELTAPTAAPFVVGESLAVDLMWAMLLKPAADEGAYPFRAARFADAPGLPGRIRDFWADDEECFTEIVLVADRVGALFEEDPDRLWSALADSAALPPRYEPLTSETDEAQIRFRDRLERLYRDPDLREGWIALLRDVWAAISPLRGAEGAQETAAAVWRYRSKLPPAGSYSDLAPLVDSNCDFHGLLPRLVADAVASGHEILVIPSWIARKAYVLTLPERLLWSPAVPARPVGPSDDTRRRARLYKALGDPTRLAIFEAIAQRSRTVGELAAELGVAQPTVSNHVRILRDAGLLTHIEGDGRRLAPDTAAYDRFLREARGAVLQAAVLAVLGPERPFERDGLG
jgi:DNA-binding transcriptional ArsR family regulator